MIATENLPAFTPNNKLTLGIELELQLIDLHDFNLIMEAKDFLRRLSEVNHSGEIKPEITQSMIEINSSVHTNYNTLLEEMSTLKNVILQEASQAHIGICGGGTHPFQRWSEQRIFPSDRFLSLSAQYGYLAKQFTIFGQHIHIGCTSGDEALYLCHALIRYLPHFIALSAASPYHQGVDTSFDCSRISMINSFPLSGILPWIHQWQDFDDYYKKMGKLNIITSIKDFYWDVRPKPEFGTIELRICDTPLTVEKAVDLAAYAQALVSWLLDKRAELSQDIYHTYPINRFRASRYGLNALLIDSNHNRHILLSEDILQTCNDINEHAMFLKSDNAIENIRKMVKEGKNDAQWLRNQYTRMQSLNDIVRMQMELWRITGSNARPLDLI